MYVQCHTACTLDIISGKMLWADAKVDQMEFEVSAWCWMYSLCRKVSGEPNKQKSPVNKCWPEGPESRIVLHMVLTRLPSIVPCLSTITTGHNMQLAKNRVHGIEAGCFWSDYNSHPSQTEWWHGYISAVIFGPNFYTQGCPPETDERIVICWRCKTAREPSSKSTRKLNS